MDGSSIKNSRRFYFSFYAPKMIMITCALPLFATVFCVVWSLMFNFEASTRTHCKVYNFLPTVSAVIGGFTPQRYVWQICIALHAPQRLMVAIGYYSYHTAVHIGANNESYKTVSAINSLLNITEILSLIGLSMISSTENKKAHENLFISFMTCALLYMMLTILLMKIGRAGSHRLPSYQEVVSLRYKTRLFIFNLSVFGVAIYLFLRHNAYCEPGVYSLFALCEYLVIFSNIAFHAVAVLDFDSIGVVMVDRSALWKDTESKYGHSGKHYHSRSVFHDYDSGVDPFMVV